MICCIDLWDPLVGEVKLKQIGAILQYCIIQALYYVYLCICFFDICWFIHADWLCANTSNMSRASSKGRSSTGVKGGRDPAWTQASSLMKFINGWSFGLFSGVSAVSFTEGKAVPTCLFLCEVGGTSWISQVGLGGVGGWCLGRGGGWLFKMIFGMGFDLKFIWAMCFKVIWDLFDICWYDIIFMYFHVMYFDIDWYIIWFVFVWYSESILYNPLSSLSYNKIWYMLQSPYMCFFFATYMFHALYILY